jgi:6,7-dimethyl-8-ribityllumazine synthase
MAHVLIVEARFYSHLNDMLLDGVRSALDAEGHSHDTVTVPGALEIPAAISLGADSGRYDAFVALGVVIRGETYHFEVVSNESARGVMAPSMALQSAMESSPSKMKNRRLRAPTRRARIRAARRQRPRSPCWP